MKARAASLFVLLALAGCGPPVPGNGAATGPVARGESRSTLDQAVVPVRVGEQGPSFAACALQGMTSEAAGGQPVPVRAAPFDEAKTVDLLSAGASFFICQRSHDQRWSGIVYQQDGAASPRCGVSAAIARRRDYAGPCAAGWVPTARVRLISGER